MLEASTRVSGSIEAVNCTNSVIPALYRVPAPNVDLIVFDSCSHPFDVVLSSASNLTIVVQGGKWVPIITTETGVSNVWNLSISVQNVHCDERAFPSDVTGTVPAAFVGLLRASADTIRDLHLTFSNVTCNFGRSTSFVHIEGTHFVTGVTFLMDSCAIYGVFDVGAVNVFANSSNDVVRLGRSTGNVSDVRIAVTRTTFQFGVSHVVREFDRQPGLFAVSGLAMARIDIVVDRATISLQLFYDPAPSMPGSAIYYEDNLYQALFDFCLPASSLGALTNTSIMVVDSDITMNYTRFVRNLNSSQTFSIAHVHSVLDNTATHPAGLVKSFSFLMVRSSVNLTATRSCLFVFLHQLQQVTNLSIQVLDLPYLWLEAMQNVKGGTPDRALSLVLTKLVVSDGVTITMRNFSMHGRALSGKQLSSSVDKSAGMNMASIDVVSIELSHHVSVSISNVTLYAELRNGSMGVIQSVITISYGLISCSLVRLVKGNGTFSDVDVVVSSSSVEAITGLKRDPTVALYFGMFSSGVTLVYPLNNCDDCSFTLLDSVARVKSMHFEELQMPTVATPMMRGYNFTAVALCFDGGATLGRLIPLLGVNVSKTMAALAQAIVHRNVVWAIRNCTAHVAKQLTTPADVAALIGLPSTIELSTLTIAAVGGRRLYPTTNALLQVFTCFTGCSVELSTFQIADVVGMSSLVKFYMSNMSVTHSNITVVDSFFEGATENLEQPLPWSARQPTVVAADSPADFVLLSNSQFNFFRNEFKRFAVLFSNASAIFLASTDNVVLLGCNVWDEAAMVPSNVFDGSPANSTQLSPLIPDLNGGVVDVRPGKFNDTFRCNSAIKVTRRTKSSLSTLTTVFSVGSLGTLALMTTVMSVEGASAMTSNIAKLQINKAALNLMMSCLGRDSSESGAAEEASFSSDPLDNPLQLQLGSALPFAGGTVVGNILIIPSIILVIRIAGQYFLAHRAKGLSGLGAFKQSCAAILQRAPQGLTQFPLIAFLQPNTCAIVGLLSSPTPPIDSAALGTFGLGITVALSSLLAWNIRIALTWLATRPVAHREHLSLLQKLTEMHSEWFVDELSESLRHRKPLLQAARALFRRLRELLEPYSCRGFLWWLLLDLAVPFASGIAAGLGFSESQGDHTCTATNSALFALIGVAAVFFVAHCATRPLNTVMDNVVVAVVALLTLLGCLFAVLQLDLALLVCNLLGALVTFACNILLLVSWVLKFVSGEWKFDRDDMRMVAFNPRMTKMLHFSAVKRIPPPQKEVEGNLMTLVSKMPTKGEEVMKSLARLISLVCEERRARQRIG